MTDASLPLVFDAVLVQNVVLAQFLGLCPLLGVSRQVGAAAGMAAATALVLVLAALACQLAWQFVLLPLGLGYLRLIVFVMLIAALVQVAELVLRQVAPLLYRVLGVYLPLITTNCAVLATVLSGVDRQLSLPAMLLWAASAAAGFGGVLVIFAGLRERIAAADVPAPFRGAPIALISAGLLALAFTGFRGFGA